MKTVRKSKRGISTVLATLMMIVIAVAGSLVTYAWVMGYLSFTTNKAGSALQIQSVSYSADPVLLTGTLKVYVQNVGQAPIILDTAGALYVNGVLKTGYTITGVSATGALNQGQTATFTDATVGPSLAGTKVVVKIVAHDGTFSENTFYPT